MSNDRYSHGIHAHAQVHVHDAADIRADELSDGGIVVRLGGQCDLFFDSRNAVYEFCGALMDLFPVVEPSPFPSASVHRYPVVQPYWRDYSLDDEWLAQQVMTTPTDVRGDDEGDLPRGEYLPPDESVQPPTMDELPVDAKTMIDIGYVRGIPGANYCASGLWQPPDQATLPLLEEGI